MIVLIRLEISPISQVGEGQIGSVNLLVEPNAEIVEGGLGSQLRLETTRFMRSFPIQMEGIEKLFHDPTKAGQSMLQVLGPGVSAVSFGW